MRGRAPGNTVCAVLRAFHVDRRASSAVEFAIISLPFIVTLLAILQMSVYYMTQSALDAGVVAAADSIVNTYYSATTPPTITGLNALVASKAGGLVQPGTVQVDLQPFGNLAAAPVPITNNTVNQGTTRSLLALRAQAPVTSFAPGFGSLLVVRSSALIRRQGQ